MNKLTEFVNDFRTLIGAAIAFSIIVINVYVAYSNVIGEIKETQIMVLTPLVKDFEVKNSIVSDADYAVYVKNYTKLRQLKIDKGLIPESAPWSPLEQRLK